MQRQNRKGGMNTKGSEENIPSFGIILVSFICDSLDIIHIHGVPKKSKTSKKVYNCVSTTYLSNDLSIVVVYIFYHKYEILYANLKSLNSLLS